MAVARTNCALEVVSLQWIAYACARSHDELSAVLMSPSHDPRSVRARANEQRGVHGHQPKGDDRPIERHHHLPTGAGSLASARCNRSKTNPQFHRLLRDGATTAPELLSCLRLRQLRFRKTPQILHILLRPRQDPPLPSLSHRCLLSQKAHIIPAPGCVCRLP